MIPKQYQVDLSMTSDTYPNTSLAIQLTGFGMTLNEYQQLALRTAPPQEPHPYDGKNTCYRDLLHGAMGLVTESGELMDVLKRNYAYGKEIDWVNVIEECGDVAFYLAILCRASGVPLEEVCRKNIAKLKVRYPDKFDAYLAVNRSLDGERKVLESK